MKTITCSELFIYFMLLLIFMACKKNDTPSTDTDDSDSIHPRLIKITIQNGYWRDTIIYDPYGQAAYNNVYVSNVDEFKSVYNSAFRYYKETGILKEVVTNTRGWIEYDGFVTYLSNDSLIFKLKTGYAHDGAYRLDKNGFPIRAYQLYDSTGNVKRLSFEWTIDSATQDVTRSRNFLYQYPLGGGFDTIPIGKRDSIYTYTKIRNPLYFIRSYNPLFALFSWVPDDMNVAALSKHMPLAYYANNQMTRSYSYELDASGKWPVKQVSHNVLAGDSIVYIYTYMKK